MVRQRLEPDHDLSEVVDDADEADGGQDDQQEEDRRVAEHPLQRRRPPRNLQVLASASKSDFLRPGESFRSNCQRRSLLTTGKRWNFKSK